MLIEFGETSQILSEAAEYGKVQSSRDEPSTSNKFRTRPQGILLQDTYNNPFFPIQPIPRLDTSKIDLLDVWKRYREIYAPFSSGMLPWHYIVELVGNKYVVFNTRPIDMRFPIRNDEVQDRADIWDDITKIFMRDRLFDITDAIHVCVLGDSNKDVYTKRTYEAIGRFCIRPMITFFKFPEGLFQRIFPLNLGRKFNVDYVSKFVRR